MPAKPNEMLNLAALARRLQIPYSSLRQLVVDGRLVPDARAGREMLFEAARVGQVARGIRAIMFAARRGISS